MCGKPRNPAPGALARVLSFGHALRKDLGRPMSVRLIILAVSLPFLMGSEIYRYVDANGVVTYAQQLPYGVKGEQIRTMPGAPRTVPATARRSKAPSSRR